MRGRGRIFLSHSRSSSPAKAGDPVSQGICDRIETLRRTGYSAFAEYDSYDDGTNAFLTPSSQGLRSHDPDRPIRLPLRPPRGDCAAALWGAVRAPAVVDLRRGGKNCAGESP